MSRIREFLGNFEGKFSVFKKHPPIVKAEDFGDFLGNRAAFIAQKTLYGYLKTRMGIAFPNMFQDDEFVKSINIAKWNIYAACLSDLAIFMAAKVMETESDNDRKSELAQHWHHWVIRSRIEGESDFKGDTEAFIKKFDERLKDVDWEEAKEGEGAFKLSPPALVHWAPIDEQFKKFDEPIVLNSIRFAWQAREYLKLLDTERFLADWAAYRDTAFEKTS